MKNKQEEQAKPVQEATKKANANAKAQPSTRKENQNKRNFILPLLLLLMIFAAIAVPVSYIPFLNNIAQKFGLPPEMTRQLTLTDLALNSLGIETDAMKAAFKQSDITAGPADPVFYSRFEPEMSHLINARETYFYEFERTRRRPAEISGIYKDGKEVSTPNLKQGQVAGVRALPKEDKMQDDSYPGASFGAAPNASQGGARGDVKGDASNSSADAGSVSGSDSAKNAADGGDDSAEGGKSSAGRSNRLNSRDVGYGTSGYSVGQDYSVAGGSQNNRQSRSSFDRTKDADGNPVAMPNFVSSVYAGPQSGGQNNGDDKPLDINNSNMIRPVVKGQSFRVGRQDTPIEQFLGSSEFASTLNGLHSFGGYGTLGFYVADDIPENTGRGTFTKFGASGEDAINSYFYSYLASGRKYSESSKYLAEIAFSGEKAANEEILIARGQKNPKPHTLPEGDSPLKVMTKVQETIRTCNEAERHYLEVTRQTRQEYVEKRNHLKNIANNNSTPYMGDVPKGAPGSCEGTVTITLTLFGYEIPIRTRDLNTPLQQARSEWNSTLHRLKQLCENLQNEEETYVNTCHMRYEVDDTLDNCNSWDALRVEGDGETSISLWDSVTTWWDEHINNNPNAWRNLDCATTVRWEIAHGPNPSPTFNGCSSPQSCQDAVDDMVSNIEQNVKVTPTGNFLGI